MKNKVQFKGIIDTTFRDGQQSPLLFDTFKYRFSTEEKKCLLEGLVKLGVNTFEFFSPVVNPAEADDFQALRQFVRKITKKKIQFITHCRCNMQDIEQAVAAGFDGLNLYMGVADHSLQHSYGKSFEAVQKIITSTIKETRKKYPHMYLRYSIEDIFRTKWEDICKVYDEVYPYVDTLGMPDTVGIATPTMVKDLVHKLKERYPKAALECHFHNDRGFSTINALTAVESGVEYVDTSVWGLAERSGITSTTEFILNLYHLDKKLCEELALPLCYPLNVLMGTILKMQVPYRESISLTNRTHTAGVHQKAVLNNSVVYEAHNLSQFGVNRKQILLGPLSGWNLVYYYLKEIMGYEISEEHAKEIAQLFKHKIKHISKRRKPETVLEEVVSQYQLARTTIAQPFGRVENFN